MALNPAKFEIDNDLLYFLMSRGQISFTKRGGSKATRRDEGYAFMNEVANHYYKENDGWFNLVDFYQDLVAHFLSLGYRHTPTKGEVKSHLFYLVRKNQYERREKKLGKRRTQEYRLQLNAPSTDPKQGRENGTTVDAQRRSVPTEDGYAWFDNLTDDVLDRSIELEEE